jgi:hypothetical protein
MKTIMGRGTGNLNIFQASMSNASDQADSNDNASVSACSNDLLQLALQNGPLDEYYHENWSPDKRLKEKKLEYVESLKSKLETESNSFKAIKISDKLVAPHADDHKKVEFSSSRDEASLPDSEIFSTESTSQSASVLDTAIDG